MYEAVIILEDDMDIAPDFFDYFEATLPILKSDPSLFCISAWNDNGQEEHVKDSSMLYRSNFFPGLGWMMTKKLWKELRLKWPDSYWDDWMREPEQRKGRDCIRPEISRTFTFGKEGSSLGQFYDKFLGKIKLNSQKILWKEKDLSYLEEKTYEKEFQKILESGKEIRGFEEVNQYNEETLIIKYKNEYHFDTIAQKFQIMTDFKAGVPRTGYKGSVIFYYKTNRIILIKDEK